MKLKPEWVIAFVLLTTGLLSALTVSTGKPLGVDWNYHLDYAREYLSCDLNWYCLTHTFTDSYLNQANHGPYPPLFHFVLAFFLSAGLAIPFGLFVQVLGFFGVIALTGYLVYKHQGAWPAAIALLLLAGSVALFDRGGQATPEAVDLFLFTLATLFVIEKKHAALLIALLIPIYAHGAYALLYLFALSCYAYLTREPGLVETLKKAWLFSLPLILLFLTELPARFSYACIANNAQETAVTTNPAFAIFYAGIALAILTIPAVIHFINKVNASNNGTQVFANQLDLLAFTWLVATFPLLVFFPDRFFSYAAVPASILSSSFVLDKFKPNLLPYLSVLLTLTYLFTNFLNWIPNFIK